MTRSIILPLSLAIASTASAGIITGGGGVAALNELVMNTTVGLEQPNLGLEKFTVPVSDFRRARARLSVSEETIVEYKSEPVQVIKRDGGITDSAGARQLVPELPAAPQ